MEPINLYDYEAIARDMIPPMAFDYYRSGALDEITLRDNHAAYDRIKLQYRVLRNAAVPIWPPRCWATRCRCRSWLPRQLFTRWPTLTASWRRRARQARRAR